MSKTTRHNNNTNNSNNDTTTNTNNNDDDDGNESECFYESLDRIASSSCSCSNSNSNSDNENDAVSVSSPNYGSDLHRKSFRAPKFPMGLSSNYDIWISEPSSVSERRSRLLRQMGLINDPSLSRTTRSISSDHLASQSDPTTSATIVRSKSDGTDRAYDLSSPPPILSIHSSSSSSSSSSSYSSFVHNSNGNNGISNCSTSGGGGGGSKSKSSSPNKLPAIRKKSSASAVEEEEIDDEGLDCEKEREKVCLIKNLDNGKEFVVNDIREEVKDVETGRQLTMEEFQMSLGHSPIVQELMRRQNVEDGNKDGLDSNSNSNMGAAAAKTKKKGGWFKSIRNVASSVTGYKERRSSDERDTSSEKGAGGGGGGGGGGRRSSSATDDSQDVSYHGPERVRVRQYGKSCKELSGLYKSQEIQAHNGSIWSIKFSLDGKYLASAGEDCDIHVWQVVDSERKGDLLSMERQDDVNFNYSFVPNGSPEPNSLSPIMDSHLERKKRGRTSVSRKSLSLDRIVVPDTVFALSDKPICSFQGHSDDVLDLSWSKSQQLLSSSMDKTVRLWHLPSKSCLKVFSHSDFVTCIQFNPVDDRYFISGSLDAKVRIWSIPDRQVVDWNDVHEMVTAACYTPDGQGALVGSHKGSCRLYNTSENKLQPKSQINLQNKKKKSHHKKISGFQFAPGSSSEVLITSADSRIRVVDGVDLVQKFKGFRNTNSQISASLTANGKYVVSASEDSYVYVWKQEADSRPSRSKGVTVTSSYELFHCQDVSVAIPWPGLADTLGLQDDCCVEQNGLDNNLDEVSTANHPPTPVEDINDGSQSASGCTNSPLHGTISSATNSYFFDRISATWPEEKLVPTTWNRSSPRVSVDGLTQNASAWDMVIVTAGRKGQIRTFQNFGLPVRI